MAAKCRGEAEAGGGSQNCNYISERIGALNSHRRDEKRQLMRVLRKAATIDLDCYIFYRHPNAVFLPTLESADRYTCYSYIVKSVTN